MFFAKILSSVRGMRIWCLVPEVAGRGLRSQVSLCCS